MLSNNINKNNQRITIIVFTARICICGGRYIKEEYGIDIISYISGKTIDRFQYIWVVIIDEIYKLIVEYLKNRFK